MSISCRLLIVVSDCAVMMVSRYFALMPNLIVELYCTVGLSSYRVPNEHFNRIECFLVGHWGDSLSLVPCDRWSCQACWGLPHHERFARPTIKQYHLQSLSNPNELDLGAVAFQSCSLTKPNMRVFHDNVDPGPHREHPRDSNEGIQDIAVFHCQCGNVNVCNPGPCKG